MDEKNVKMEVDGLGTSGVRDIDMKYPSNSHRSKTSEKERNSKKVISGNVVTRKKSLGKKIGETFLGDDTKSVGQYILYDVLIPAAKSTISDMVTGGIEMLLFGESRSSGRSRRSRTYSNYSSYYSGERERKPTIYHSRSRHSFDDIILETREDAEEILTSLVDYIEDYGQATVSDLYDFLGKTGDFTDNKWGWDNLRTASVSRVREGYLLNLPKPIPLD